MNCHHQSFKNKRQFGTLGLPSSYLALLTLQQAFFYHTILSRNVLPWQASVKNVGAFLSGNAGNVVPHNAILRFSIWNMEAELSQMI